MLIKAIAKMDHSFINSIISISNPWNINTVMTDLTKSKFGNFFLWHFGKKWKDVFRRYSLFLLITIITIKIILFRNSETFLKDHPHLNYQNIINAPTLAELDDALTRRIYGFDNVDTFYSESSCHLDLMNINNIPIFIIHALDDPIVPERALPKQHWREKDNVFVVLTPRGGHSGLNFYYSPKLTNYNNNSFS